MLKSDWFSEHSFPPEVILGFECHAPGDLNTDTTVSNKILQIKHKDQFRYRS
jgi:hypothetical protein